MNYVKMESPIVGEKNHIIDKSHFYNDNKI